MWMVTTQREGGALDPQGPVSEAMAGLSTTWPAKMSVTACHTRTTNNSVPAAPAAMPATSV